MQPFADEAWEEHMKGKQYLTKPQQYALVYNRGNSRVTNLLVMRALPNGLAFSRYGFSVSKRVGKAVIRNRMKRRLREILRALPLKPGWDIVFIVRATAASTDFATFRSSVNNLLSRGRLLELGEEQRLLADVKTGGCGESFS